MSTATIHQSFYQASLAALEQDLYGNQTRFPLVVQLGSQAYQFGIWAGEQLPDPLVAIDTETELIENNQIPRLALTTIYGQQGGGWFIHPAQLSDFIRQHSQACYCAHNASFDFWTIAQALEQDQQALQLWWDVAGQGRLCCTMLLDALLRLADCDAEPVNRALDVVALEYAGLTIDKEDPYRLRYAELLGLTAEQWRDQPAGFFSYAAKDPIATLLVFQQQISRARALIQPHKQQLLPGAWGSYGPLTACLQTQGAIALDQISRTGCCVDITAARQLQAETSQRIQEHLQALEQLAGPELQLFRRYKRGDRAGQYMLSKSGSPKRDSKAIKAKLEQIAQRAVEPIQPPRLKNGTISDAPAYWLQHTHLDPFIDHYCQFHELAGLLKFFRELKQDRIYPRYIPLVRTGRTSCRKPNLQQLPRDSRYRELIVAPEGYHLLQVDYSVLELRTLAQVCLQRYGRSRLAELFQAGQDPHRYTAALLLGLTMEQFAQLPTAEQKQHRQQAKAVNFGVPGGLGPASLVSYAKASYNVTLTFDEAKELRRRLCEEIYPELSAYLQDQPWAMLAENLQASESLARQGFQQRRQLEHAFRIVAGEPAAASGDEYSQELIAHVWLCLAQLNRNPALAEQIERRQPSLELARRIFWGPAVTISGRLRGHVGFTQRANSPFSSLAADGAKLALFRLLQAGYRLCGFIHDEVLVLIQDGTDYDAAVREVQTILADSMQELTPAIPIATEFFLADRWYKEHPDQPRDSQGRILPYVSPQQQRSTASAEQPTAAQEQRSLVVKQPQARAEPTGPGQTAAAAAPSLKQSAVAAASAPAAKPKRSSRPKPPPAALEQPAAAAVAAAAAAAGPAPVAKARRSKGSRQPKQIVTQAARDPSSLAVFVDPLQLGLSDPLEVKQQAAAIVEVKAITSSPSPAQLAQAAAARLDSLLPPAAGDPQPAAPAIEQLTQREARAIQQLLQAGVAPAVVAACFGITLTAVLGNQSHQELLPCN